MVTLLCTSKLTRAAHQNLRLEAARRITRQFVQTAEPVLRDVCRSSERCAECVLLNEHGNLRVALRLQPLGLALRIDGEWLLADQIRRVGY